MPGKGFPTQIQTPQNVAAAPAPRENPSGTSLWSRLAERIPLRILAADDVRTNRELLRRLTAYFGYDAELVENGAEAVAALGRTPFDLVLLDVQMPVMNGLEAAREIVRLNPSPGQRPKLVAITADSPDAGHQECLEAGMDDCLDKPISPRAFETCVMRLFADPATGAAPRRLAVFPARPALPPLVDLKELEEAIPGLSAAQRVAIQRRMHRAGITDFETILPRVTAAVSRQDQAQLAEALHALKGCFSALGWKRIAGRCVDELKRARQGKFTEWLTLPGELEQLYAESTAEMTRLLDLMEGPGEPPSADGPETNR